METISTRITISEDGRVRLDVPTTLPAGEAEVLLVIQPTRGDAGGPGRYRSLRKFIGSLSWTGDAVIEQRRLRDEWPE
jgi:hypothetical protein